MSGSNQPAGGYAGFEQGPIRPPNEARSLLVRVTRNCPWNRCAFCPVYKSEKFSVRPASDVKRDIDLVHEQVELLRALVDRAGKVSLEAIQRASGRVPPQEWEAFAAAAEWVHAGDMRSVFLQDADSLVVKPTALVDILTHLRRRFPSVRRVTSYARARTVFKRRLEDLRTIRRAGLSRVHIGLESGSDAVLARVCKGSTKDIQIEAGMKAKLAGMELSEYVMPGLGGRDLWEVHARETADTLNRIDPHFIRLRTLAIPPHAPLHEEWKKGRFAKSGDTLVVRELLLLLENLDGVTSYVVSDHVLNLFMELQGKLPEHKQRMIDLLNAYLEMDADIQRLYQIGRRLGIMTRIADMADKLKMARAEEACRELGVTAENVDDIADQLMMGFV